MQSIVAQEIISTKVSVVRTVFPVEDRDDDLILDQLGNLPEALSQPVVHIVICVSFQIWAAPFGSQIQFHN